MQQRRRTWCRLWLLALALAACDARAPAASDPHDPATMDFKSPPARVTTARHTGAFAAGNALSMTAALKPLDQGPVKEVRLDATHKIIEIAPGVKFAGWTLGDQVPGPTIRARVGDRIRFTMTNRSDESVPGVRVTTAPMMHSMDFREVVTVRPEATVGELADAFWAHHVTSFPVVDGGTVRGIASLQQVREVPPEQRTQRRVSELMRPLTDELIVGPDDSVFDALGKATRNQLGRLAVLKDSRLVGYLPLKDITHVLALRGLPDGDRSAHGAGVGARGPDRRAA